VSADAGRRRGSPFTPVRRAQRSLIDLAFRDFSYVYRYILITNTIRNHIGPNRHGSHDGHRKYPSRHRAKHVQAPGCDQPVVPAAGPGRPPVYCEGRGHTKVTAWRERRRLAAAQAGTTASPAYTDTPVTMARATGAELLRALRAEADRVSGIADRLREAVETVTDPTAAEAEIEAVRAAAEQRAAAADARAAAAEQRPAEAD
jgi:hypothetical protein